MGLDEEEVDFMRISAKVEVDRTRAPHDNTRLLPHNMRVELLDSNILIITELGTDFRMVVTFEEHMVLNALKPVPQPPGVNSLDWL